MVITSGTCRGLAWLNCERCHRAFDHLHLVVVEPESASEGRQSQLAGVGAAEWGDTRSLGGELILGRRREVA